MKATHCPFISNDESFVIFDCNFKDIIVVDENEVKLVPGEEQSVTSLTPSKSNIICFIKLLYMYNSGGKFGVKKIVSKIKLLD